MNSRDSSNDLLCFDIEKRTFTQLEANGIIPPNLMNPSVHFYNSITKKKKIKQKIEKIKN